jgi:3-hydroxyacyl-CoA dehydrogenase/enoyl-CoA hydratase/3-hydroxybutyryl-CoA epimerase
MQLVEVVKTDRSRNEDVAQLVDFVKKFGKTPIVTSDSPGFVVNRILFPYLDEAVRLHCEGVGVAEIDQALKRFGMPMGPMELLDQVGIDVAMHVAGSLAGLSQEPSPTAERLREMVSQGRLGRKTGQGFYLYPKGATGKGISVKLASAGIHISEEDIRDRIILRLVNEAAKCLQENVVSEAWMVDLAMVLGTGFAPNRGGPLRMCEKSGYGEAVEKLEYFQKTVGPRFAPAQWLIDQIEYHSEPNVV